MQVACNATGRGLIMAEWIGSHEYMYSQYGCRCGWTGPGSHQAHQGVALCEAYKEGKLTK